MANGNPDGLSCEWNSSVKEGEMPVRKPPLQPENHKKSQMITRRNSNQTAELLTEGGRVEVHGGCFTLE